MVLRIYLWTQYIHCRCSTGLIRNRWKPHYSGIKQDKGRLKSRRGGGNGGTGTAFNKLIAPLFSYLLTASIHGAINGTAWPINFALLFAYTAHNAALNAHEERAFARELIYRRRLVNYHIRPEYGLCCLDRVSRRTLMRRVERRRGILCEGTVTAIIRLVSHTSDVVTLKNEFHPFIFLKLILLIIFTPHLVCTCLFLLL